MLSFTFPFLNKQQVEYVWMARGIMRSKIRILQNIPLSPKPEDFPQWTYDGSSTGESTVGRSERVLIPSRVFSHPFERGWVVWCDTASLGERGCIEFDTSQHQARANHREGLWFGFEQEFYFEKNDSINVTPSIYFDGKTKKSVIQSSADLHSRMNYCGVGQGVERKAVQEFARLAIQMGLSLYGTNQEVAPSQWEFQIGTGDALNMADELWVARWLMGRVAERYGWKVNYEPMPRLAGVSEKYSFNGSGCHTNISTPEMRDRMADSFEERIQPVLERMRENHLEFMVNYSGENNEERMSGENETEQFDRFSWGVNSRDTSIRVPHQSVRENAGYIEDRRPAANVDPYKLVSYYSSVLAK